MGEDECCLTAGVACCLLECRYERATLACLSICTSHRLEASRRGPCLDVGSLCVLGRCRDGVKRAPAGRREVDATLIAALGRVGAVVKASPRARGGDCEEELLSCGEVGARMVR